jgi:8-oxo-dGTP diphosphatase
VAETGFFWQMNVRPALAIYRDDQILLMRYRYGNFDVYALPGGNPDPGEGLPETLERELHEELQLDVEVFGFMFCGVVSRSKQAEDVLHCVFYGEVFDGEPILDPAHTTALAVEWIAVDKLPSLNLYPNVGTALEEYFHSRKPTTQYLGKIEQAYFG